MWNREQEMYCNSTVDVERVCNEIIGYTPKLLDQVNVNPVLEKVADFLEESESLRDVAFELAEELESPRKEYQQIHSIAGESAGVSKAKRNVLRELYGKCIDHKELSELEKLRLKGLMLDTLYSEYNYFEADDLAAEMKDHIESLPWQAAYSLVDFYNKTRRYDECELLISTARKVYAEDVAGRFDEVEAKCKKYRECSEKGKKEYIPNPKEDK